MPAINNKNVITYLEEAMTACRKKVREDHPDFDFMDAVYYMGVFNSLRQWALKNPVTRETLKPKLKAGILEWKEKEGREAEKYVEAYQLVMKYFLGNRLSI